MSHSNIPRLLKVFWALLLFLKMSYRSRAIVLEMERIRCIMTRSKHIEATECDFVQGERSSEGLDIDYNDIVDNHDSHDNNESDRNHGLDKSVKDDDSGSRRTSFAPSLDSRTGSISSDGSSALCTPHLSRASSFNTPGTDPQALNDLLTLKGIVEAPSEYYQSRNTAPAICTPPNAKRTQRGLAPLSVPSASLLRPTTFWRHHPLSPHALPHHSPASRLIRRSILIASPTISVQHPNPDAETTRIAIGLAGLDLDIDPRRSRKLSIVPT
ncbi:hypothetical protein IAR55_005744 [Kwoniella newhampshirensis]|uniref:Uncharacterized protein n=1 Tax=Kwoniella newhampshirensis TaxID=1651941 RepID=A0AAW0YKS0_9TREE